MKKGGFILLLGLVLCGVGFLGFYYVGTASTRALASESQPELAWLKKEFRLSDAEFARITRLHEAYLPQCAQRCTRIAELNQTLEQMLNQSTNITPQIQQVLAERGKMRAACEAEMLNHFLEVSRMMPPEQGRRYLQWVEQETVLNCLAMEQRHQASTPSNHQHHSMGDHAM